MRLCCLALLLCTASADGAGVYKWTDANGVVHFSDRQIGPDEATEVPGMQVGPSKSTDTSARKPSQATLQGVWCQSEKFGGSSGFPTRIEWSFRETRIDSYDIDRNVRIVGVFSLKDRTLITDQPNIGNLTIVGLTADQMDLGTADGFFTLHRGACPAAVVR